MKRSIEKELKDKCLSLIQGNKTAKGCEFDDLYETEQFIVLKVMQSFGLEYEYIKALSSALEVDCESEEEYFKNKLSE